MKCGDSWRNSIFSVPEYDHPDHVSIIGEEYIGCFKDAEKRDLGTYIAVAEGNVKLCFEEASRLGFAYAGLQYRSQCFAGNSVGAHGQAFDGECYMECKNDEGVRCGAGWRNSVFHVPTYEHPPHNPVIGEEYIGCFVDA